MKLPILIVASLAGIGFILGWQTSRTGKGLSLSELGQESSYLTLPIDTDQEDDLERISDDVFGFLEQRSTLSIEAFYDLLEARKDHPLAIIDQLPIYDAVGRISLTDFKTVADRMILKAGDKFWDEVLHVLLYRWANEDPEGIIAYVNESPSNDAIERSIPIIVSAMAWKSLDQASRFLERISESPYSMMNGYVALRNEARNQGDTNLHATINELLKSKYDFSSREPLGKVTVETVREAIANRDWEGNRNRNLGRMLGELAKEDPNTALELASLIDSPQVQGQAISYVISSWANDHPAEALSASLHMFDEFNDLSGRIVGNALSKALKANPDEAIAMIEGEFGDIGDSDYMIRIASRFQFGKEFLPLAEQLPDSFAKDQIMIRVAQRWLREDADAALDWSEKNLPQNEYEKVMVNAIRAKTKNSPEDALEALKVIENPHNLQQALSQVASNWPMDRFDELVDWAASHEDSNTRELAIQQMVGPWIRQDMEGASAFAQSLPEGKTRRAYERTIGDTLVSHGDPNAAIEYANSIQDLQTRNDIITGTFNRIGNQDPEAAIRLLEQQTNLEQRTRSDIAYSVARSWAHLDIESAANYFASGGDFQNRKGILNNLTNDWLHLDSKGALNWVSNIKDSSLRNATIENLMHQERQIKQDPAGFLKLAESIQDPESRARAFSRLERSLDRIN